MTAPYTLPGAHGQGETTLDFPLQSRLILIFPFLGFCLPIHIPMDNNNIHRIKTDDREIILVGTAHVSRDSAELVEKVIEEERPDTVCVELCQSRYDAIMQKTDWEEMDILKIIRQKRTSLLLSQLIMASFQKKLAERFK